jgi:hypothetical protein
MKQDETKHRLCHAIRASTILFCTAALFIFRGKANKAAYFPRQIAALLWVSDGSMGFGIGCRTRR